MTRFEDRHSGRIFDLLGTLEQLLDQDVIPHLDTIVAEQRAAVAHLIKQDDAGDRIARQFGHFKVSIGQFIPDPRVQNAAERTAGEVNQANGDFNQETIRSMLGVDPFVAETWLPGELEHFTHENVSLIRGLVDEQAADLEQMVFRMVQGGEGGPAIIKEIEKIMDTGRSRAKLIARDQIGKFNGRLTMLRQRQIGVEQYTWRTSDDERVRPAHQVLDDTKQSWNNPPVTVRGGKRSGERNHPGQDIQCRCIAEPIFPEELTR